jgi:hypothetical protein
MLCYLLVLSTNTCSSSTHGSSCHNGTRTGTGKSEETKGGDTPVASLKLFDQYTIHYYPLENFPPFLTLIVLYLYIGLFKYLFISKFFPQKKSPLGVAWKKNR